MKRICIFVTYDQDKIVDNYVGYMLKELKTCVQSLVVVCNQQEIVKGLENITRYADNIFFRENIGYDAGAFKDALCSLIGWNKIYEYDELVLVNDSFFGPFIPMVEIFNELDLKVWDFCGLSKHAETITFDHSYYPEHIQSFFLRVGSKMLHSIEFKEYWEKLPYFKRFEDVVQHHEVIFTKYFRNLGYKYDVLMQAGCNDSANILNNYNQYGLLSYELISRRKFPFLKRKPLRDNTLKQQTQENIKQAIDYIDKCTSYDVNLIWENIIRTMDLDELQHSLHLRYIISDKGSLNLINNAIIIINAKWENAIDLVTLYLEGISEIKIIIISPYENLRNQYEKKGYIVMSELDNHLLSNYELICYLEDEDLSSNVKPNYIAKSYMYGIWNNLVKNSSYINNIIESFINEKHLGVLFPPKANFAFYFGNEFENMAGWYRREIFINYYLTGSRKSTKKFLKDHLFYFGVVENEEFASMNETNLTYYLEHVIRQVKKQYGEFSTFLEMSKLISQGAIDKLCRNKDRILVYGIGYMSKQYSDIIPHFEGYIVSDGQENPGNFMGKKVYYLSEVTDKNEVGVIICVDEKNQPPIIQQLVENGILDFVCI